MYCGFSISESDLSTTFILVGLYGSDITSKSQILWKLAFRAVSKLLIPTSNVPGGLILLVDVSLDLGSLIPKAFFRLGEKYNFF